jgi:adenosine deaminase
MTREAMLLVERVGWTRHDLRTMAINAMKSAFLPHPERVALIETVLKPAYS